MPPRNPPRARGRGGGSPPRGRGAPGVGRGSGRGTAPPTAAAHVVGLGARRPNYGTAGRRYGVYINAFETSIPQTQIYHYDVVEPGSLPARVNLELFTHLQNQQPNVFAPKIVYDGQKNAFSPRELELGSDGSKKFSVTLPQSNTGSSTGGGSSTRGPRVYHITLNHVATINPNVLERFINGQQSHTEEVLTAITALNVILRMEPTLNNPFNKRSFFTPNETRDIGGGIELWRGIFQSVRPAVGRMIVNIDLATGMMYKSGRLIDLGFDFFGLAPNTSPMVFSPAQRFVDQRRIQLQKFITGLRITIPARTGNKAYTVRGISAEGANSIMFDHNGTQTSVAQYFQGLNIRLQFPQVVCVLVGRSAMIPLELCMVPKGQIMRKQVPQNKVRDVLEFSSKRPPDRRQSIIQGFNSLNYTTSEYVQSFGMNISNTIMQIDARVLDPPTITYNSSSRQPTIVPKDGAWNMMDKKFIRPSSIACWALVIYEIPNKFTDRDIEELKRGFLTAASKVGINIANQEPHVVRHNPQGVVAKNLQDAGGALFQKYRAPPSLMVVILPEAGAEIYQAVKHFGDVTRGVPTQCLKATKVRRANDQYYANVMLKVNVKIGGINCIPDPNSPFVDPARPTIVIGADTMHPPPGVTDRPSYSAVVGSVDTSLAKYVATSSVQTGRQEIIDDFQKMAKHVISLNLSYRAGQEKAKVVNPSRLVYFRDGVSEGQFKHVLDAELPALKAACEELNITPKITVVIVGKRHHIQPTPKENERTDRSLNVPAGLVIDTDVVNPIDFDFYLCSHQGILGTSRPAHYSVLHEEGNFQSADAIQKFAFLLTHVYARATRSVSIPAPVYYADIVCARAKNHFDPGSRLTTSETATATSGATGGALEAYQSEYKPLADSQQRLMYFS